MVCKEGVTEKNKYLRADSAKLLLEEPLSLEKLPHHGLPTGQVPILGGRYRESVRKARHQGRIDLVRFPFPHT